MEGEAPLEDRFSQRALMRPTEEYFCCISTILRERFSEAVAEIERTETEDRERDGKCFWTKGESGRHNERRR